MQKINNKTQGINTKPKAYILKHTKTTPSLKLNRHSREQVEPLENESNFQKYKSKGSGNKHKNVGSQTRDYLVSGSQLRNEMATARSQINEFEIEEFFRSLEALLSNSLHDNISFDTAEFLYRRLDGYERNISVLLARLRESFPAEEQLLEDLGNLLEIVRLQRERCETLSFHSFLAEDQETNGQALTSVTVNRNGVGRPTLDVSQQFLEILHFQVGFSWSQIARDLGISESTLRRRRRSFQIPNSQQSFSNISDNALDQIVREILHVTPRIGYRLVQGALRQRQIL